MGSPVARFEIGAAVDWFEVLGADAGRSQALYAELFGWAVPEGLGAIREYGPNPVDDHTWTGMFRDPAGSPFGVYRHGPH